MQPKVLPHTLRWPGRLAAALIYILIRSAAATVRLRIADSSAQTWTDFKTPVLFCTWHNRLAVSLTMYEHYIGRHLPDRRLAALVSASKDGGLLARVLEHFHVQPVRGSTSRRGPQALLELTTWAEQGYDLAITPDGPRGPRYVVQEGVLALAQLTGLPIVPISSYITPKFCLKSWDRFQVPCPFGRCEITIGEMLRVPREATETERAALRAELENRMRQLTRDD